ncbi:MAG TPA: LemA family protein [bacterium]|mgnify:CR=1 FL=1|nr:LemA family protein [bacterium]
MSLTWIILIVIVVIVLAVIAMYNRLIRLNVRTDEAWSDIDVQLRRRYDLIPNLVETVKGYAKHESEAFENVTKARAEALGAQSVTDKSKAENQLEGALKSIFAVAEAYPELKANENFAKLQADLTDTEDKIQAARRFYNANVRDMNIAVQTFPTNIFANMLGFKKRDLFELDEEAAKGPVKVDFSK